MSSSEITDTTEKTTTLPLPVAVILAHPYLTLLVLGLVVRVAAGFMITQPGYVDAYYYYQVAENWVSGQGLVEKTLWSYQLSSFRPVVPPADLTHAALDYWNPLTAWLIVASFRLFGVSFWAAQLPFLLCAAGLPALAFYVGRLAFGYNQQRYSWTMAFACLFAGRYFVYWNNTDNFAPFAVIAILCLICIYKGLYQNDLWLIAAGALSGLAYLSRSDGILLAVTLVISFLWVRWRGSAAIRFVLPRWGLLAAGLGVALLVVAPWLLRNLNEFGAVLSPYSSRVLYLREYNDIFSYALSLNPDYYFSWGWDKIIGVKINALWIDFLLITAQGLFGLAPFFLLGLGRIRQNTIFLPFFVYLFVLYFTMSLVFTEVGVHGTIFHSAGALLPYQAGAAVAGCEWLGRWLLRRRKKLAYETRQRMVMQIGAGVAGVVIIISAALTLLYAINEARDWDEPVKYSREVDNWFVSNNVAKDVIIVGEPTSYYYATRQPAIGQASDGVAANLAAARQYGAKYLVLSQLHYSALDELYRTKNAPEAAGLKLELVAEFGEHQIYRINRG